MFMAKAMTKSQIADHIAKKADIKKKLAVQILEDMAALAYKEAKNAFTLPDWRSHQDTGQDSCEVPRRESRKRGYPRQEIDYTAVIMKTTKRHSGHPGCLLCLACNRPH
jgi:hypothetical protein